MTDRFLHRTVRLEWWNEIHALDGSPMKLRGPYPSRDSAHADIPQSIRDRTHFCKTIWKEIDVEIDPILSSAVQGIAGLVSAWFGKTDPTNPFAPRPSGYVKMAHVEASMKQLSEVILKTFEINKENPDVPEDQEQG